MTNPDALRGNEARPAADRIGESERHRAFLRQLGDALRAQPDEAAAANLAIRLLAGELAADRCFVAELHLPNDRADVPYQLVRPGFAPLPTPLPPSFFPAALRQTDEPTPVVYDVAEEPALADSEGRALAALGFGAFVAAALRDGDRNPFWALVTVSAAPRLWTAGEIRLIEEVSERTWAAISLCREAEARIRAEEFAQRSEEKYRTFFDTIGEGLAIIELLRDPAGKVVDVIYQEVNGAFERHTGWSGAGGRRRSEIAPIADDEWLDGVERVARTGQAERWEAYSRNARRWYRCFLSRVGGEGSNLLVLIFENITGRKHRERNQILLTAITDDLGGPQKVAETMARLGEKIGRHFDASWCVLAEPGALAESLVASHSWHAADVPSLAENWPLYGFLAQEPLASHLRGAPVVASDTEKDPRVSAESYRTLGIRSFISVPLVRGGVCRFLLAIYDRNAREWRDEEVELMGELTQRIWARLERARSEEALRHSEAELRALAAELQEADRRKNDFLAMLGHELRNPLAAIRGGVLLLRSEKARPESRAAALPVVAEQVTHMERLVDDLLDLTRIVQGRVQLRRERLAVQEALRQALEMVRPQAEPEGFVIEVNAPAEALEIFGDQVRLTQVLMNVLANAVKYSGDSRRIEVVAAREGEAAVVRVRDHGVGIPAELLPRIFEPFVQAKPGLTLQAGLGLGLAVVRQLVRLHDGEVEAFSEGERRGSEFVLRLPLLAS